MEFVKFEPSLDQLLDAFVASQNLNLLLKNKNLITMSIFQEERFILNFNLI